MRQKDKHQNNHIALYVWPGSCCSVAHSCSTLCDPKNCNTPGLPVLTISQSLLKPMSIESVMPSNHLILCCPFSSCPQSFPASGSFPMSQLNSMKRPGSGPCLIQSCTAFKLSYSLSSFTSSEEGITDFWKESNCICLEC